MQIKRGFTATSETQLLASWFKVLTPLLGHLGCQSLDLGPSLLLSMGQFLLRPLGSLQLPTQALHLGLRRFQMVKVGGASYLRLIGQAQEPRLHH
jgi:hypothetical protein